MFCKGSWGLWSMRSFRTQTDWGSAIFNIRLSRSSLCIWQKRMKLEDSGGALWAGREVMNAWGWAPSLHMATPNLKEGGGLDGRWWTREAGPCLCTWPHLTSKRGVGWTGGDGHVRLGPISARGVGVCVVQSMETGPQGDHPVTQ